MFFTQKPKKPIIALDPSFEIMHEEISILDWVIKFPKKGSDLEKIDKKNNTVFHILNSCWHWKYLFPTDNWKPINTYNEVN